MVDRPVRTRAVEAAGVLLLGVVYLVTARAGLRLASVQHSVTLVWPPSGLALAVLLSVSPRLWPGIALGAFVVNVTTPGVPIASAVAMAAGNTAEALLGVALLRRAHFDPALRRVPDLFRLVTLAGLVSAMPSALVGTVALRLGGVISTAQMPLSLRVWWLGDLMGILIVAPLLWSLRGLRAYRPRPRPVRVVEAAALAAVFLFLTSAIFALPPGDVGRGYLRSYVVFPPLLWAALRFPMPGPVLANFALAGLAIWRTVHGRGPFALTSPAEALVNLQIFMGIAVVTSLVLAAAAAERADAIQAREDFISIASHELRTPLTPLALQIERMRRRLARGDSSPDGMDEIQMSLQRQANRLTGLVDILLDITRLRSGRMSLERESVDLAVLARETVEALADELGRAGCEVTVEAPRPVVGRWDRTRLQQAVTNLLTNAAKYGAGAPVTVAVASEGDQARLVVSDRGPGIAFAEQARLFRRFARLPSSRSRAGGLGLGLYITREIVEAHGGSIRLESRPGEGASFICTLPVPQA
jgi:signal transduction histidine kinase